MMGNNYDQLRVTLTVPQSSFTRSKSKALFQLKQISSSIQISTAIIIQNDFGLIQLAYTKV